MGKTKRGTPDGTGPYTGSAQSRISKIGKKQQQGKPCPVKKKK